MVFIIERKVDFDKSRFCSTSSHRPLDRAARTRNFFDAGRAESDHSGIGRGGQPGARAGRKPKIVIANRPDLHIDTLRKMSTAKQQRILVVDDEAPIRALLAALLEDKGYEVLTAADGEEAIVSAITNHPDLILLDVCMPHMDGMQACAKLRKNLVTRDIPVIFLTAFNSDERLEQAIDMGANDFLGKPVNAVELNVRIQAMLQTHSIPDDVERLEEYIKTMKALRKK